MSGRSSQRGPSQDMMLRIHFLKKIDMPIIFHVPFVVSYIAFVGSLLIQLSCKSNFSILQNMIMHIRAVILLRQGVRQAGKFVVGNILFVEEEKLS